MIYDISPTIEEALAVWPGDVPFTRQWQCQIDKGSNIDLSSLSSTVHLGSHADAPSHYEGGAASISEVPLEPYCGPCYVKKVDVGRGELITKNHLEGDDKLKSSKRVLIATGTYPNPNQFNEDFAAFDASAIEYLGQLGVQLIGIDTPSFDPFSSKDLPAHHTLFKYGIRNLEGLVLSDIEEGEWELIALPLKLKGFDGSPVRAILRTL